MPLNAKQLAALIDSHAAALRVWTRSRCSSEDDVVQEAFCRLAVEEPPPRNPVAWLYSVCRNLAQSQRRSDSRRRRREQDRSIEAAVSADPVDDAERAEALAAVERLDDSLREVLVARIWGGLTLEEVAELCGISIATAFRRYRAALENLRSQLTSDVSKP